MSWRHAFIKHCAPCGLTGTTFGDWWTLLRENRFRIDLRYWPRAALVTSGSLSNSLIRWWEDWRYGARVDAVNVPPPLFVLGIWRSGTTHLHNLLTKDDRFSYPNLMQVFYPHTFLTTEQVSRRLMNWFLPPTRPMDNVRYSVDDPQEDEFALFASGLTSMLTLTFPRTGERYRRWMTLRDASAEDRERWKSMLLRFVRKLTIHDGRPLILKSPAHTGRIRLLLELFPDAKFVHIRRHPYDVYRSTVHAWRKAQGYWALQRGTPDEARVIRDYVDIYDAYFEERGLVPAGRLCEIAYEDLEREPLETLQRLYESLSLPEFGHARPAVRRYLESLAGYERNSFSELPVESRARLSQAFQRCFAEWGYAP